MTGRFMPTNKHSRVTACAKISLAAVLTTGLVVGLPSAIAVADTYADRTEADGDPAATESPSAAHRFTIGLPAEVTLVGLTLGIRPEVLYRFGCAGARSRLRVAIGLLDGPDQFFVPVSVGYRAIFRQRSTVNPMVGAGGEMQNRMVSDFPTVRQYGVYLEGGLGIKATQRLTFDFAAALDVMLLGGPGAGLGLRLGVQIAL
jgi:hypothetical protein